MNLQNIKLNKYKMIGAGVLTLGLLGAGATIVSAAGNTSTYPPIVEKISERFGLDNEEVGSFFEEEHAMRGAEVKERHEEHLSQLVNEGVVTEEQKDALDAKHDEMQANRESNREEMDAFFEEIGLDPSVIRPEGNGMGEHMMGGRGGFGHFGPRE
ncbi:hypothetical protein GW793_04205 [bacterium]|nr:hypothetical protein [bacterium]